MPSKQSATEFLNKAFGKLFIIEDLGVRKGGRFVLAKCECGTEKSYRLADVKRGASTNCGCVRIGKVADRNYKHGLSNHVLHRVWMGMKERCYYEKHEAFHHYGGKGIVVCDEWKDDFMCFYNWAITNGWAKGLTIERDNSNGNYEPNNCRIATQKEQCRNKSNNRILEYNGQSKCITEWAEEMGVKETLIRHRIDRLGWPVDRAIITPPLSKIKLYAP